MRCRVGVACGLVLLAAGVSAQENPRQAQRQAQRQNAAPGAEPGGSPAEIPRMFDSDALMQGQDQLQTTDDQSPQSLTRFRALQDTRRQALQQRLEARQEL